MQIVNFAEQNSVMNHFMAELRDKKYQQNRLLFRNNIQRIGELMAYELSKTLDYRPKTITSPLGQAIIPLTKQSDIVLATVLRAGLPFHEGFLEMFDNVDNGFVSAFRMYINIPRWAYTQSTSPHKARRTRRSSSWIPCWQRVAVWLLPSRA